MPDDNLLDFSSALQLRQLRNELDAMSDAVVCANELSMQHIPQCKLVQQFLAAHNLPWQAFYMPLAIPREQLKELGAYLEALYMKIEGERMRLREAYGVQNESELSTDSRPIFDAALRSFILREDHYP